MVAVGQGITQCVVGRVEVGFGQNQAAQNLLHFVGTPQLFGRDCQLVTQFGVARKFLQRLGKQRVGRLLLLVVAQQLQFQGDFVACVIRVFFGQLAYQGARLVHAALLRQHHGAAQLHFGGVLRAVDARQVVHGLDQIAVFLRDLRQQQIGLHGAARGEDCLGVGLLFCAGGCGCRQQSQVALERLFSPGQRLVLKFDGAAYQPGLRVVRLGAAERFDLGQRLRVALQLDQFADVAHVDLGHWFGRKVGRQQRLGGLEISIEQIHAQQRHVVRQWVEASAFARCGQGGIFGAGQQAQVADHGPGHRPGVGARQVFGQGFFEQIGGGGFVTGAGKKAAHKHNGGAALALVGAGQQTLRGCQRIAQAV